MKGFEEKAHQDDPAAARRRPISRLFRKAIPFISGTMIAIGTAMPACAINMFATGEMRAGRAESDNGIVKQSANSAGLTIRTDDIGLFLEFAISKKNVDRSASMSGSPMNVATREIVAQQSVALMAANDVLALGALNFKLTGVYPALAPNTAAFEVTDTATSERVNHSVAFNESCRFVMNGKTYKIEVEGGDASNNVYVRALRTEGIRSDASTSFETSMNDESIVWGLGAGYKTANWGAFVEGYVESVERRIRNSLMVGGDVVSAYDQEEEKQLIGAIAKLHYKRLLLSGTIDREKRSADASFAQGRIGVLADYTQENINHYNAQWMSRTTSAAVLFRIIRDKENFIDFGIRQGFERYVVTTDGSFLDAAGDLKRARTSRSFKSSPTGPVIKFRKAALEGELAADIYYSKAVRPKIALKYRW